MNTQKNKRVKYRGNRDSAHKDSSFHTLIEMDGFLKNSNERVYIKISTNEYHKKPHFHIESENFTFCSSILLEKAKYYKDSDRCDKLSKRQKEILNDYISRQNCMHEGSVWATCVFLWQLSHYARSYNIEYRPDYTKLK